MYPNRTRTPVCVIIDGTTLCPTREKCTYALLTISCNCFRFARNDYMYRVTAAVDRRMKQHEDALT